MTDEVAGVETTTESSEADEAPTTPAFDEATWRKRLAGKDQALTASQQKAAAAEAELAKLRQWKAEKEQADMSEVDRLRAELAEAQSAASQAQADAQRAALSAKYPLSFEVLGDAAPLDAVKLAELEARLKGESDEEPEPRIDPNNPRRSALRAGPRTIDDIKADIAKMSVPSNLGGPV